jgi:hypothetical protein
MKKGAFGAGVFQTADCRKTYEEMKAKGVEFLSPPKDQFLWRGSRVQRSIWQLVQHDATQERISGRSLLLNP